VKVRLRAAMIVLSVASLAGCAAGGYDASAARSHLVAAGLTSRQAACVVRHMGPRFGVGRLGARARPTTAELKAQRALLQACGVKPTP
jgi:hypothetical protein